MASAHQKAFQKFLQNLNNLLDTKGIKRPSAFISYAWETGQDNDAIQKFLKELEADLKQIGIDTFLDTKNMQGEMRECMREIQQRDYILSIGTLRYKQRAEQDRLYLLNKSDNTLPSIAANAVILYDGSNEIKFIRDGKLHPSVVYKNLDINDIAWIQEPNGIRCARPSTKVNQIIEDAISSIGNYQITNVAYELGLILDKMLVAPKSVLPLVYKGGFNTSFPEDISRTTLIRDFSNSNNYFLNMAELNPLGLIPAMCPELMSLPEYMQLLATLRYELDWSVDIWRSQALETSKVDPLYIIGRGDSSPDCKKSKPLTEHVSDFLLSKDANVMLLLGTSGTGKSMFAMSLADQQWRKWHAGERIPMLVNLPTIGDYQTRLMQEALLANRVPASQIAELQKQPLLLILDGYDEIKTSGNLYESNNLKEWDVKVIITCRPENLTSKNYKSQFKPKDSNLWERYLAHFSNEEIDEYLQQYVTKKKPIWPSALSRGDVTWEMYKDNINQLPGLFELIQTPFLLRIATESLPTLLERYNKKPAGTKNTLVSLYEAFINDWFVKHIERWKENSNIHILDEGLKEESDDIESLNEKRIKVLRDYSEQLAFKMFTSNIDAVPLKAVSQFPWIVEFFDNKPRPRLIRNSCPILLSGEDFYSFLHKSILEFLVTPRLQQEILHGAKSSSSDDYLNGEYLNQSPAVVRFLADAVIENPKLQECLWEVIEASKKNHDLVIASANAATILNAANISFAGRDLSYTHLAGADLSHGIFGDTNFYGANIRNVNFQGAWLKNADLRSANKEGVYFGERPYLTLHNKPNSCIFSADNKFMIVNDGANILLFDSENHQLQATLSGHADSILALCSVASKNRLISASADKTIKIWDLSEKTCLATLTGHDAAVKSLFYDVDNTVLYSASADGKIIAWNLVSREIIYTANGHIGAINSISLDPNDQHLISAGADGSIKTWHAKTGKLIDTIMNSHYDTEPFVRMDVYPVTSVLYHEKSNTIISGGVDKKIKIWNKMNKDVPLRVLKDEHGHTSGITSLIAHPNGDMLLSTADWDRTARLWLIENGSLLKTFEGHTDFVIAAAIDPDQLSFVTVSNDRTIRFWEMSSPGITKISDGHTWSGTYVAYSPNGKALASSSWDKTVKIWDTDTGMLLRTLRNHNDMVRSVAYSKDGNKLASASDDSIVRVWDPQTGELLKTLGGHKKSAKTVSFHPFASILASGSLDCSIRLWNLRDDSYSELLGHTDCVREIFFNSDGSKLVSASQDSSVRVWDTETKIQICIFSGQHQGWVRTAAFHPNGKDVVSAGSNDKQVIVWDSETGAVKYRLNGHDQFITGVAFSPDAKYLVSVGMDNKLLIYDTQTRKVIFKTCSATPYAVCWGIQNKQILLATANADNAIRCWKVDQNIADHLIVLLWSSYQASLCTEGTLVDDKTTLPEHLELIRQHGINQITENNSEEHATDAPTINDQQRNKSKPRCSLS